MEVIPSKAEVGLGLREAGEESKEGGNKSKKGKGARTQWREGKNKGGKTRGKKGGRGSASGVGVERKGEGL